MRFAFLCLALLLTGPGTVGAQEDRSLAERLGPATWEAVRAVLEQAARDSVPVRALEAKALEGLAKRRPGPQIAAAVRRLHQEMAAARTLLRDAAPAAPLTDGEIVIAAEAMRRGVPGPDMAALRRDAPPASLEIPFAVLTELVNRGVPAADGRAVIQHALETGVPPSRLVELSARVDVALRVGAPPASALGSALQSLGIPVPPGVRDRIRDRPGRRN